MLSPDAWHAVDATPQRCVSAASLYELIYKARIGKWPEVQPLLGVDLARRLQREGFEVVPASGPVMQRAAALDWSHRDPFDRIIVATALDYRLPVVSKDATLDSNGQPDWRRIW